MNLSALPIEVQRWCKARPDGSLGDLEVDLTSPSSTTVRLHNRTGGPTTDLVTTYDMPTAPDGPGSMTDFDGEPVNGTWTLRVADRAASEIGQLNSWTLTIWESTSVSCTPVPAPEVSPPGSDVPFQMGIDAAETIEFELNPNPGLVYHLYHVDSIASMQAGDWTNKWCDLETSTQGTWTPVDADTVRWTPASPGLLPPGLWVVVAEDAGLEGSYGADSLGAPRAADLDGLGSVGSFDCP